MLLGRPGIVPEGTEICLFHQGVHFLARRLSCRVDDGLGFGTAQLLELSGRGDDGGAFNSKVFELIFENTALGIGTLVNLTLFS